MQSIFQVPSFVAATSTILLALQSDAVADQLENASRFGNTTLCTLGFHMLRWSPIYRQAEGTGTIRCTNGQRMNVSLAAFGAASLRETRGSETASVFSPRFGISTN